MITIEQINAEIAALEGEKPTYQVMEKLANLYIVRDHMVSGQTRTVEKAVEIIPAANDPCTEFYRAISGKCTKDAMDLFDEVMTTLAAVNPRLYDSVMRRL